MAVKRVSDLFSCTTWQLWSESCVVLYGAVGGGCKDNVFACFWFSQFKESPRKHTCSGMNMWMHSWKNTFVYLIWKVIIFLKFPILINFASHLFLSFVPLGKLSQMEKAFAVCSKKQWIQALPRQRASMFRPRDSFTYNLSPLGRRGHLPPAFTRCGIL